MRESAYNILYSAWEILHQAREALASAGKAEGVIGTAANLIFTALELDPEESEPEAEILNLQTSQLPNSQTAPLPNSQTESAAPEEITTGRARIMRLIGERTPPDIPTLVRACVDDGMTAGYVAALTGLGYNAIAKCKTGYVSATTAERFGELFAFPRQPRNTEEE